MRSALAFPRARGLPMHYGWHCHVREALTANKL